MEERRKTGHRRVNTRRQGAPFCCTRQIADRRRNNLPTPKKYWSEYDIDLIPHAIRYPTDPGVLNEAREFSEPIIDELYPTTELESSARSE